ncbi:rubrerythrin family protein, partial [Candidatus Pacearchaeota archaeon]
MLDKKERGIFLKLQKDEATANLIYTKISVKEKNSHNKEILRKIAEEEKKHYEILKSYTKTDVHPNRFTIFLYSLI